MQGTLLERMDRETRALAILAAAALVFIIAAVFALASSSRVVAPAFEPQPFFPELAQTLGGVNEVVISTKDETLRIAKTGEGQWVLPDKDNYPVRRGPLREVLLGLGELMKERPATANKEWHKELRLGAPEEGGEATRITLKREDGSEIVSLLVGEQADLPDITGLESWYVREPGEQRSWLARGALSLSLDPASWIVTDVVPVKAEQIKSATIRPPQGPAYTVARENEEAKSFTLKNVPEGAEVLGPRVADGVGQAIAELEVKDVSLASDFNFNNAPMARYRTFDGLEITVRTLELGEDIWATIEARYDGKPGGDAAESFDASSLAADINQRVAGWAFLLPPYKGKQMRLPVSDMVRQVAPPAPETPEGTVPGEESAGVPAEGTGQDGVEGGAQESAEDTEAGAGTEGEQPADSGPDGGEAPSGTPAPAGGEKPENPAPAGDNAPGEEEGGSDG